MIEQGSNDELNQGRYAVPSYGDFAQLAEAGTSVGPGDQEITAPGQGAEEGAGDVDGNAWGETLTYFTGDVLERAASMNAMRALSEKRAARLGEQIKGLQAQQDVALRDVASYKSRVRDVYATGRDGLWERMRQTSEAGGEFAAGEEAVACAIALSPYDGNPETNHTRRLRTAAAMEAGSAIVPGELAMVRFTADEVDVQRGITVTGVKFVGGVAEHNGLSIGMDPRYRDFTIGINGKGVPLESVLRPLEGTDPLTGDLQMDEVSPNLVVTTGEEVKHTIHQYALPYSDLVQQHDEWHSANATPMLTELAAYRQDAALRDRSMRSMVSVINAAADAGIAIEARDRHERMCGQLIGYTLDAIDTSVSQEPYEQGLRALRHMYGPEHTLQLADDLTAASAARFDQMGSRHRIDAVNRIVTQLLDGINTHTPSESGAQETE